MGLVETIDALIADWIDQPIPELTPRHMVLARVRGKVDAVVGMRRSGKTYLLYQEIARLRSSGVPLAQTLYVNFEDERLAPLDARDLHRIPDALYRRFPEVRGRECWFFFDEIQNVSGWERFVRRLVDAGRTHVTVTGSSARLLSREIATSLRGRSLATELLPFSFAETLAHESIEVPRTWPAPARTRSLLENRFAGYLERGGFPEVQRVSDDLRRRILQDYLDVVILRDVAERNGITNIPALRALTRPLLRSPSGRFTVNRLYNDLRSQGVGVGKDALHAWVRHLEDAYLFFTVERHGGSIRQRQVNPRKCYLVDPGLARAVSLPGVTDVGHVLENVVYLELRRRGCTVGYVATAAGTEVNFHVHRSSGKPELVQVCASLADAKTRARELRAIADARQELGPLPATVVTLHDDEQLEASDGAVRVVPAWRWLLES